MSRLSFDCRHRYPTGFELDARFEAGAGVTALFGPSGSGKSTVLSIIAGMCRPAGGSVRLGDRVLFDGGRRVWLPPEKRGIGFVFQDLLLFPHLTVEANLRFGARRRPLRSIPFERVVEVLELGRLLRRHPHTLSGGERQRTALGRAILRGPELLLLDEPLTALDEGLKERVLSYLERAFDEWRIPTLFVSHDQTEVRRLAGEVVILQEGRVVDAGVTVPVLDRAVMTKMKLRTGPVNLLRVEDLRQVEGHWEGTLSGQRFQLPSELPVGEKSVSVQFLPRDVTLGRGDLGGLSVRNRLSGRVREVVALPDRAFVAVDVGQFLWSEVTLEAVRELELKPEAPVTCLIKTSAVQVLR
jgi:molybdate transport system ATP-binding protein